MGLGRELLDDYAWELQQGEPDMNIKFYWKTGNNTQAECSVCGFVFPFFVALHDYCPHCGARLGSVYRKEG